MNDVRTIGDLLLSGDMELHELDDQYEPEIEERDECNTCGRTEYMCPGH